MHSLGEIKNEQEKRISELIKSVDLFFAFSQTQFAEGAKLHPLKEGDKYIQVFGGGILPKSNYEAYKQGLADIEAWYTEATSDPAMRRALIIYELGNHEAFYNGDIQPVLDMLGDGYTYEEVYDIYLTESPKQTIYG
jgi:hypothetical protein